jgi:glycosyltransferase involved in cell wall biosynthesis
MEYISVIVPAYNSQDTIEQCLVAVRQSTHQNYELIVVDNKSQDATRSIAQKYADKVVELDGNLKRSQVRNKGIGVSRGEIIVNIDSDIIIRPDTLARIVHYFSQHPHIHAVNGLLSKEHPHTGFFSQYKNLYMNYIFNRLPEKVTFLYGSIHALRRKDSQPYDSDIEIADDTALGQQLVGYGKQIGFIKDLEVIHLKKYGLFSFIKNDFQIPFDWAKIFLKYKGWKQLGKNKTGFAHSPKEQLISVVLAPTIFLLSILCLLGYLSFSLILPLILVWFIFNIRFLAFLVKERGLLFGVLAFFVTLIDNIVMAIGILCGFAMFLYQQYANDYINKVVI